MLNSSLRTPSLYVNHYLPNKFSLYVAKDKWHNTYSGNTGYIKFNARIGSFIKDCFKKELIKLAPKVDFNDRDKKLFYSP